MGSNTTKITPSTDTLSFVVVPFPAYVILSWLLHLSDEFSNQLPLGIKDLQCHETRLWQGIEDLRVIPERIRSVLIKAVV
jgi:hypothetical protein